MSSWRGSVFGRVAALLIGAQVLVALLAVGLSAYFAQTRSRELAASGIRLRLDALAEEIERRADLSAGDLATLPLPLQLDLSARFPDPVWLVDTLGKPVFVARPDSELFGPYPEMPRALPTALTFWLRRDTLVVHLEGDGWGMAPLYDLGGQRVGTVVVYPLRRSLARELAGTQQAYYRALAVTLGAAVLLALLLGAFFTRQLVRPLRRVVAQVQRIQAGDWEARLPVARDDEFGRLARAVNEMAQAVARSIRSLEETDRMRRELMAGIGHDLRTPLAALLGYAEEARRLLQQGNTAAAAEALAVVEERGRHLQRLVEALFELSLLERPEPSLHLEPVPLGELLDETFRAHRRLFQDAGLTLQADWPLALPVVEADGARLRRVLDNLLDNARRHTPAGGEVRLGAQATDTEIRIQVQDTGPGLSPEQQARLFEPYGRREDGTSRGLGLLISQAIARAHGGRLEVTSARGQGSTFTLILPRREVQFDG